MPFRHISSEICNMLRSFWKGNYYIPCTGHSTADAPIVSEVSHKSQKIKLTFPHSLFSVLPH